MRECLSLNALIFLLCLSVFKNSLEVAALFVAHVGSFPLAVNFFTFFVLRQDVAAGLVNGVKISLTDEWHMKTGLAGGVKYEGSNAMSMEMFSC
jgi:hypothetical protein